MCGAQDCCSMARAVSELISLGTEVWTFKSVSCGGHSAERSSPRGRTGSRAAPLPHSALINCCGSRTVPTLTHVQLPLPGYLMIFPIYSPKGDIALLGRPAKDIKPIPCSSAVAAASAPASRSPAASGVLSHRDKNC